MGWEECGYSAHKRPAIGSEALHQARAPCLPCSVAHHSHGDPWRTDACRESLCLVPPVHMLQAEHASYRL